MSHTCIRFAVSSLMATTCLLVGFSASATTLYWTGDNGTNWDTGTANSNWTPIRFGPTPPLWATTDRGGATSL